MKVSKLQKKPRTQSLNKFIKFLFLVLTLFNFIFDGIHYLRKLGCAMGTICAPNYANIFMGKFERKFIYPCLQTFSNIFIIYFSNRSFYSGMEVKHTD